MFGTASSFSSSSTTVTEDTISGEEGDSDWEDAASTGVSTLTSPTLASLTVSGTSSRRLKGKPSQDSPSVKSVRKNLLPEFSDNEAFSSSSGVISREEEERQVRNLLQQSGRRRRGRHRARRKIVGSRRKRADQIRSTFAVPDLLRSCEAMQVECFGFSDDPFAVVGLGQRGGDMWDLFEKEDNPTDNVVVAVEVSARCQISLFPRLFCMSVIFSIHLCIAAQATAICGMDVEMRRGVSAEAVSFPFVLGSNFVGVIHNSGPSAEKLGLKPGARVASITKWGSNSKYVTIPATCLSIVPKHLDAAEVVATISTYLPAFQALYHGSKREKRYHRANLSRRKVLVTGGASLEVQATLILARLAGASELYTTAPRHHFTYLKRLSGVTVLDENPKEWKAMLKGKMDVVVDYDYPKNLKYVQRSLQTKGRLVCIAEKKDAIEASDWASTIESFLSMTQLSLTSRGSVFDFSQNVEQHPDDLREDIDFLLKLLSARQLRPKIDRFIGLSEVPRAHQEMQTLPVSGAIICEPWKE